MAKGFSPGAIRFFMMQASYRSVLDLTNDGLLAAEKGFNRLLEAIANLDKLKVDTSSSFAIKEWQQKCYDAMNDDFNTPILIAHLFEAVKMINQIKDDKALITVEDLELLKETINTFTFSVLGLEISQSSDDGIDKLNATIELLIKLRKEARLNKDFALSDKIRDELAEVGIELKDGREGTTFSVK
jgi:cysteinyl-tRNA synthetase